MIIKSDNHYDTIAARNTQIVSVYNALAHESREVKSDAGWEVANCAYSN